MPRDACIRTTPEDRLGAEEVWSLEADLLALAVEVISVQASGRQLRKPVEIKRPKAKDKDKAVARRQRPPTTDEVDASYKRGIGVLAATSKGVRRA